MNIENIKAQAAHDLVHTGAPTVFAAIQLGTKGEEREDLIRRYFAIEMRILAAIGYPGRDKDLETLVESTVQFADAMDVKIARKLAGLK